MERSTLRIIQLILTLLLLSAAIAFAGDIDEPRSCCVNCGADSIAGETKCYNQYSWEQCRAVGGSYRFGFECKDREDCVDDGSYGMPESEAPCCRTRVWRRDWIGEVPELCEITTREKCDDQCGTFVTFPACLTCDDVSKKDCLANGCGPTDVFSSRR